MNERRRAAEVAREILNSPEYRESLVARLKDRTLPPEIEELLWEHAFGERRHHTVVRFNDRLGARPLRVIEAPAKFKD